MNDHGFRDAVQAFFRPNSVYVELRERQKKRSELGKLQGILPLQHGPLRSLGKENQAGGRVECAAPNVHGRQQLES